MRQWGIDTAFPLIPYDSQKLCASDLSIFHPASSSCIVRNSDFVHFLLTQFCHSSFDCAMHLPRASPQSNNSTITLIWIPVPINLMERERVHFFSFLTENILCCMGREDEILSCNLHSVDCDPQLRLRTQFLPSWRTYMTRFHFLSLGA